MGNGPWGNPHDLLRPHGRQARRGDFRADAPSPAHRRIAEEGIRCILVGLPSPSCCRRSISIPCTRNIRGADFPDREEPRHLPISAVGHQVMSDVSADTPGSGPVAPDWRGAVRLALGLVLALRLGLGLFMGAAWVVVRSRIRRIRFRTSRSTVSSRCRRLIWARPCSASGRDGMASSISTWRCAAMPTWRKAQPSSFRSTPTLTRLDHPRHARHHRRRPSRFDDRRGLCLHLPDPDRSALVRHGGREVGGGLPRRLSRWPSS